MLSKFTPRRYFESQGYSFTTEEFHALCDRFKWKCFYCSGELDDLSAVPDHNVPKSRGGLNVIANIVPSCRSCNSRKGTMTAEEFIASRVKSAFQPERKPL